MAGRREDGWNVEKTFREGQAKQRLDDLFLYFIKVAEKLKPKVVIAENVKGLITGNAKGWVNQIVRAFDEAGYMVQVFLFNAARMGVPQKRERVFFIAHRKDLKLPRLSMEFKSKPIPFKTVREPYGKPFSENSLAAILMKYRLPTDRSLQDINMRVRRKNSGYTMPIISDDEPAKTITSGSSLYRMCDGMLINDRGIRVDMPFVKQALAIDEISRNRLIEKMKKLTNLENPNSVAQMKTWLSDNGMETDTLGKKTVAALIGETEGDVLEALSLRLQLAKSSVKKYQAMENAACMDDRCRGMFQFYGANRTGRFAGRLV